MHFNFQAVTFTSSSHVNRAVVDIQCVPLLEQSSKLEKKFTGHLVQCPIDSYWTEQESTGPRLFGRENDILKFPSYDGSYYVMALSIHPPVLLSVYPSIRTPIFLSEDTHFCAITQKVILGIPYFAE